MRWAVLCRGTQSSHLPAVAGASRPAGQLVARPAVAALAGHSPRPRALGRHAMETWHGWSRRVMSRWGAAGWLILPLMLAGCITLNIPGGKPGKLIETVVEGKRGPKIALVAI